MIPIRDVIAILDMATKEESKATDEFLKVAREEGLLQDLSAGKATSFVVTSQKVYLSAISSLTLRRRALFPGEVAPIDPGGEKG